MKRAVVYHSERFDLVSYGNGLAYALHDNIMRKSMFVQGDDATAFRDEWNAYPEDLPFDDFFVEQLAIRE